MNRVESLLRAAVRDEAAEVGPESVPSFQPAGRPARRRPRPLRNLPSRGTLTPLLAAAAVVAVVALALTLSSVLPGSGAGHRATTGGLAIGPTLGADQVPPYSVALTATGTPPGAHPLTITVRSTLDGRTLATVSPPSGFGTFTLVEGTASATTFLVGAQPWRPAPASRVPARADNETDTAQPVTLFWLRYDPSAGAVRLSLVPVPRLSDVGLASVSVSPDGSRIAVAHRETGDAWIRSQVSVYPLGGGAPHTWSTPDADPTLLPRSITGDVTALSWAADGRSLAFPLSASPGSGVYLLDTGDTGTANLITASRLVLPMPGGARDGFACATAPQLTADCAAVLCGGFALPAGWSGQAAGFPAGPVNQGFAEFSVRTGRLVAILGAARAPVQYKSTTAAGTFINDIFPVLLWASADAQVTVGLTDDGHAAVVRDGHVRRIPWPAAIASPSGTTVPSIAW
jgi:hypothetical protein